MKYPIKILQDELESQNWSYKEMINNKAIEEKGKTATQMLKDIEELKKAIEILNSENIKEDKL